MPGSRTARALRHGPSALDIAASRPLADRLTSEQVDTDTGEISPPKLETLDAMWAEIEQVVPRHEPAAAIDDE